MPLAGDFDAIVLAGGRARRLGGVDKPGLDVGGRSLLARVVAAVRDAERIVVVGPPQSLDLDVRWRREDPQGGGPVAALAAGIGDTTAPVVLLVAADLPWLGPVVPRLVAAAPQDGRAVLVDAAGRVNHLAAAWSRAALVSALARLPHLPGAAMRQLADGVPSVEVQDTGGWGLDCDTWDDVAAARGRARAAQASSSSPE